MTSIVKSKRNEAIIYFVLLPISLHLATFVLLIFGTYQWFFPSDMAFGAAILAGILFAGPAAAGLLFGGLILMPFFAIYVLEAVRLYRKGTTQNKKVLFLRGILNPVPAFTLLCLAVWALFIFKLLSDPK